MADDTSMTRARLLEHLRVVYLQNAALPLDEDAGEFTTRTFAEANEITYSTASGIIQKLLSGGKAEEAGERYTGKGHYSMAYRMKAR